MDFRQTLSAELPPPRDGEPPSLRQDILDELADHLAGAHKRELLRGVGPGDVQARVLERFGDPVAVARRLWLDAMRERIMLQRVLVASCLVVMLICVGFTGFAWVQMNRARAAAEFDRARAAVEAAVANRRMSEALAESQATNKDLLGQIHDVSEALRHLRSPDWNPLRLKLVQGSAGGPPAARVDVKLHRSREAPVVMLSRTSDASGIVDFGVVQPGEYRFRVNTRWDSGWEDGTGLINVRPGTDLLKTVVCPKTPPERVPVTVHSRLPAELEAQNVLLFAVFQHRYLELEPCVIWQTQVAVPRDGKEPSAAALKTARRSTPQGMTPPWIGSPARAILCGPGAERVWTKDARGLYVWALFRSGSESEMEEIAEHGRGVRADILEKDLEGRTDTKQMEIGTYALSGLFVLRPVWAPEIPPRRRRYEVLVACLPNGASQVIEFLQGPPTENLDSTFITEPSPRAMSATPCLAALELPADYWKQAVFEARLGQPKEWTIPTPDELIKAVRARLAGDPATQSKSATAKPKSKP